MMFRGCHFGVVRVSWSSSASYTWSSSLVVVAGALAWRADQVAPADGPEDEALEDGAGVAAPGSSCSPMLYDDEYI